MVLLQVLALHLAGLGCAGCDRGGSSGRFSPGIDVSHYQGQIDWSRVQSDDLAFAFVKATGGNDYADPTFPDNWVAAKRAGLLRGAYHFFHPKVSAEEQATWFVEHLKADPGELPPAVDVEEYKEEYKDHSCADLLKALQKFVATVQRELQKPVMVYTNAETWDTSMCGSQALGTQPLWVAEYSRARTRPRLPKGFSGWAFWQFTPRGSESGISKRVDTDRFNGTLAELRSRW